MVDMGISKSLKGSTMKIDKKNQFSRQGIFLKIGSIESQ